MNNSTGLPQQQQQQQQRQPFNGSLAASLLPSLVQLANHSALASHANENDPDARTGKLEVGKQATQLRTALASLKAQAQAIPAGHLGLDDQEFLIEKLEQELENKRFAFGLPRLVCVCAKT
ncbi:hypothetical protein T439DRAFT_290106 [Meredithblackwellia eburnea MCA 4105]